MVSARVSPSKFAHLWATALGVAPIPTGPLSLSPVVLSLCPSDLFRFLIFQLCSNLCLELSSGLSAYFRASGLQPAGRLLLPRPSLVRVVFCGHTPGGLRAARPPLGSDLCASWGQGASSGLCGVRGEPGLGPIVVEGPTVGDGGR